MIFNKKCGFYPKTTTLGGKIKPRSGLRLNIAS